MFPLIFHFGKYNKHSNLFQFYFFILCNHVILIKSDILCWKTKLIHSSDYLQKIWKWKWKLHQVAVTHLHYGYHGKMLTFCPTCANVLVVEEGQNCYRFACNTCPYVQNIQRKVQIVSDVYIEVHILCDKDWKRIWDDRCSVN